ncbi:DUF6328 family protein [Propionibacteriaceae bacterium Y2011]|uniref:DUF6328 family protein n=1 Tax=Microlunatus sp. Y2014 TaxID=3418488 RepID=UPI003B479903
MNREPDRQRDADASDESGRHETELEKFDRNWAELLQELRVTQMGTQIMTGFLLAAAFQPRVAELTPFQQVVYLTLVALGVVTTALGLAPVVLHRQLFRQGMKRRIVRIGHVILRVVLIGVGLMLVGTATLITDLVLGFDAALIAGGAVLVVIVLIAVLPPVLAGKRQ